MTVPNHVAIIPDGNRRWARQRGLKPWEGHRAGADGFQKISETALKLQIPFVTAWLGSEDNLRKRSQLEVQFLLQLLGKALNRSDFIRNLETHQVHFRLVGRWQELLANTQSLARVVQKRETETAHFTKHHLTILFGYDGQSEMLAAIEKLGEHRSKVTGEALMQALWTGFLPPVDLVIRTGGEPHWSAGFMMWHTANSQFYFSKKLWPDFDPPEFQKALHDYAGRERRFGK